MDQICQLAIYVNELSVSYVTDVLIEVGNFPRSDAKSYAQLLSQYGKIVVGKNTYDVLNPFCNILKEKGLDAQIEDL